MTKSIMKNKILKGGFTTVLILSVLIISAALPLAVKADSLGVTVSVSPNPANVGQTVTFTASPSGGSGSYTYTWSGCPDTGSSTCQTSYQSAGNYTASVLVSSAGQAVTGTRLVTVNGQQANPLGVTVSVSPNPANVGQTVTFSASPTGGSGFYTYTWSGCPDTGSSTCQTSYQSAGNYTASVLVSSAGQAVTGTRSVTVNGGGNIVCSSSSQCGTNGVVGGLFCQGNSVYQNYITYTCNNPGTVSSFCSNSTTSQLQTTCNGNQTCQNGACVNNGNIICSSDSQCGTNGLVGGLFCQGNSVYQNYINYTCHYPGTVSSFCSNSTTSQLQTTCTGNQVCTNGSCTNNCTPNYQQRCFGSNLYWYDSCGNQGNFIQYCANGCSNGACLNNNCTPNAQQRCSGNSLYWYDSCGNQGNLIQYCANGCSNGACINNNCTSNYQQRCSGNSLYWYDSCGNQQNLIQYCANGCYNNACQNSNITDPLTVAKTVKNLTTGSGFSTSTYASPSDMLMFMITLRATGNQDVQNVFVRDTLPSDLIYNNQLIVACTGNNSNCNNNNYNYSGSITSGISLNTIYAGQTVTITYQAQVASAQNFSYGTTTVNNNVSVTSSTYGYTPTASATVFVTRSTVLGAVLGASTVSTGLTNNFWVDSFFLPLLITLIGLWMWRSGMFYGIEKWLDNKKKIRRGYKAEKELSARIAQIQKLGN